MIVRGTRGAFQSEWIALRVEEMGYSTGSIYMLPQKERAKIANELVRKAHAEMNTRKRGLGRRVITASQWSPPGGPGSGVPNVSGTLAQALLDPDPRSTTIVPGLQVEITVEALRKIILDNFKLTPQQFSELPMDEQNKIHRTLHRLVRKAMRKLNREGRPGILDAEEDDESADAARAERTALHEALREWEAGPLRLEHPQGSSYHHLVDYDTKRNAPTGDNMLDIERMYGPPQIFVVERDWARAFAGYELEGECPMPFDHCCFEFRISGVRVLAFVREEQGIGTLLYSVYGRGGTWVVDDYCYVVEGSLMTPHKHHPEVRLDRREFPRVNRLVWDNIRVACIMVDANVAERTPRIASPALVKRRVQERRAAPRNHYVVDLKRRVRYVQTARTAGGTPSGRAPQRGHFRRGNYFYYDDVDSGKQPWMNPGGFWISRTWRSWYFAGDPDNIIEREYLL
jgi:hypothetical protein